MRVGRVSRLGAALRATPGNGSQTAATLRCKVLALESTLDGPNTAMSASSNRPRPIEPTPIDFGAVENLRYIRSTIEAAHTFTTVPGKGCIAMGITALAAVGAESLPSLELHWLAVWVGAAIVACCSALWFMEQKARAQGLSLRRAVAKRFFMTLAPAFIAGAILTAALAGRVDRELITGMWLLLYCAGQAAC